ncbi:MAG: response regulator transcription factor, partial [bacterium]|nr:response regulator transcription factor [bacterium]
EMVGEARDGDEAAALYSRLLPDFVTMDLTMRGRDGLAGTRLIRAFDPQAKIVLFSIVEDQRMIDQAMDSGVVACVHKSRPQELLECLRQLSGTSA